MAMALILSGAVRIGHFRTAQVANSGFLTDYLAADTTTRLPFASHWRSDVL
jgi:hypothetical protein